MKANWGEIITIIIEGVCAIIGGIGGSLLNSGVCAVAGAEDSDELADKLNENFKKGSKK